MIVYFTLLALLGILIVAELVVLFTPVKSKIRKAGSEVPVTILMVVRNEETSIRKSVQSLLNQSHAQFELLISDDESSDATPEILRSFEGDPRVRCFYSRFEIDTTRNAKAQHLGHLMEESKNEVFAVTDGDCVYPPQWLQTLLANKPEVGIVSGTTGIYNSTHENLDWLVNTGRIVALNKLGIRTTAIGNNMLFDKEAYELTEGWEKIAASITEDHELNRQIETNGGTSRILFNAEVLAKAEKEGFPGVFVQRRRWMRGAFKLSLSVVLVLLLRLMVLPLLLSIGILSYLNTTYYPELSIACISGYIVVKAVVDLKLIASLGIKFPLPILGYQINAMIQSFGLALYFIFTPKVTWKGRTY